MEMIKSRSYLSSRDISRVGLHSASLTIRALCVFLQVWGFVRARAFDDDAPTNIAIIELTSLDWAWKNTFSVQTY